MAAAATSEHREATSDSISIITNELFHLSRVPAAGVGPYTHQQPQRAELLRAPSRESTARSSCPPSALLPVLIKDTLIPFLELKHHSQAGVAKGSLFSQLVEQSLNLFFLQGAGGCGPSTRHPFISHFSISREATALHLPSSKPEASCASRCDYSTSRKQCLCKDTHLWRRRTSLQRAELHQLLFSPSLHSNPARLAQKLPKLPRSARRAGTRRAGPAQPCCQHSLQNVLSFLGVIPVPCLLSWYQSKTTSA